MISPRFTDLHNRFGPSTLSLLHQSLNISDKVQALIRKQRLLAYPDGTAFAGECGLFCICSAHTNHTLGVLREYDFDQRRDTDQQWIREIHFFDPEHYLILCCTYAQAKAFINVQHIEIDLSFKMVNGKTNVFSISAWNLQAQRLNTYAYAFLNLETRAAYAVMFSKLFHMLGEVASSPVRFPHIQRGGNEIYTITLDMCKKQAPGMFIPWHMRGIYAE
jgi:hypothetical protein